MTRRTYAAFMAQWPEKSTKVLMTVPKLEIKNFVTDQYTWKKLINTVVGDMQRIIEYPKIGFKYIKSTIKSYASL